MRVAAVISDLMLYSRIESAASAAGASLVRASAPADLPQNLDLVLVDWSARDPAWADALRASPGRVILFGQPHRPRGPRRRSRRRSRTDVGPIEACRRALHAHGDGRLLTAP